MPNNIFFNDRDIDDEKCDYTRDFVLFFFFTVPSLQQVKIIIIVIIIIIILKQSIFNRSR